MCPFIYIYIYIYIHLGVCLCVFALTGVLLNLKITTEEIVIIMLNVEHISIDESIKIRFRGWEQTEGTTIFKPFLLNDSSRKYLDNNYTNRVCTLSFIVK